VLTLVGRAALAGNRLGAVRDAKGKSVAQVFAGLGAGQKAEVSPVRWRARGRSLTFGMVQILRALAFKVLGSMS
jgi:hypothetical protein